jgi:hypothetical protein
MEFGEIVISLLIVTKSIDVDFRDTTPTLAYLLD